MSSHLSTSSPVSGWVTARSTACQPKLLKHLHFVQSLEARQGGRLGRVAFELHDSFLNRNIDSLLVATSGDVAPHLLPNTREFHRLGPDQMFLSPALARKAHQLVENADIIHGHGLYVGTNWILGSKCRRRRKALVYHPQGSFEPWFLHRSKWKKRLAHVLFENRNFKTARLWRALTNREADQIRAQGIRAPIVVAPNGIRLESFDNVALEPRARLRRRILFLGSLHPINGLDLLLQSWARLSPRHRDWELVIAGPDEDGYLPTLRALVRKLHLENNVSFPGFFTGSRKVSLLKSADLFARTPHTEGFPVAILEAMACRIPVLLTTSCHFPELAAAGGGFECRAEFAAVTKCLQEALETPDQERQERGECGRRLVESRYTWPVISETIIGACEHHCR